jgi:hypothetical protein
MSVVIVMMLIVFAFASMANNTLAYTTSIKNSTMTTANALSFSLDNIQTKKVRVGDINIAYKIFGQGEPLLLIPGFSLGPGFDAYWRRKSKKVRTISTMTDTITALFAVQGVNLLVKDPLIKIQNQLTN